MNAMWVRPMIDPGIEIGWWIDPAHQRQGYALESARALRDEAADRLRATELVARIQAPNEASRAVAGRLGLEPVGEARDVNGVAFVLFRGPIPPRA